MPNPNTQTTNTATLSVENKVFYDTTLLRNAQPNLVYTQFGKKVPIPKGRGKFIEFRRFSAFKKATTPLVEGVTPDGTPMEATAIQAKVEQYGDYTTLSDLIDMTAIDDVVTEAVELHGSNAGLTIDTVTRNELMLGTHVMFAPTVVAGVETTVTNRKDLDGTAKITAKLVNKAATFLKKMNAPKINGKYVAIINPSVSEDLREDNAWIEAHKYSAATQLFNGEIGELHGIRFVETTEATVFKGADLASDSRELAANGAISSSQNYITFDGGTVAADELIGRYILVGSDKYYVIDNDTTKIYIADPITKQATTISSLADDTVIYPGEGGKDGCAVYGCVFLGKEAYSMTDIEEGVKTIIKPLGSGGANDPLDQRSTVGWKHPAYATKITQPDYILRLECGSSYSDVDEAN